MRAALVSKDLTFTNFRQSAVVTLGQVTWSGLWPIAAQQKFIREI